MQPDAPHHRSFMAKEAHGRGQIRFKITDRRGLRASSVPWADKWSFRSLFKRVPPAAFGAARELPEPLVGETYVDEAGLTVTRYPARYAAGSFVQVVTARSKR